VCRPKRSRRCAPDSAGMTMRAAVASGLPEHSRSRLGEDDSMLLGAASAPGLSGRRNRIAANERLRVATLASQSGGRFQTGQVRPVPGPRRTLIDRPTKTAGRIETSPATRRAQGVPAEANVAITISDAQNIRGRRSTSATTVGHGVAGNSKAERGQQRPFRARTKRGGGAIRTGPVHRVPPRQRADRECD